MANQTIDSGCLDADAAMARIGADVTMQPTFWQVATARRGQSSKNNLKKRTA